MLEKNEQTKTQTKNCEEWYRGQKETVAPRKDENSEFGTFSMKVMFCHMAVFQDPMVT